MKISPWVRAACLYFFVTFAAGFAFGTLRVLFLVPLLGERLAVLCEIPLMLAVSWWACAWSLHRLKVPPHPILRIQMGLLALVLLLAAEWLLAVGVFHQSPQQILAGYQSVAGATGLLAQAVFACIPWVQSRISVSK